MNLQVDAKDERYFLKTHLYCVYKKRNACPISGNENLLLPKKKNIQQYATKLERLDGYHKENNLPNKMYLH